MRCFYLVFDRYNDFSIKSDTRTERLGQVRRSHNLMSTSPLPAKEITMKVTKTKVKLISLITEDLLSHFKETKSRHKIIVTSQNSCPEECHNGVRKIRKDMETSHDEADVIIPQQIRFAMEEGKTSVKVICEDTDVFVLLCHFYHLHSWKISVYMEGFSTENTIICIKSTVERHTDRNHAIIIISACIWLRYCTNNVWYWIEEGVEYDKENTIGIFWSKRC